MRVSHVNLGFPDTISNLQIGLSTTTITYTSTSSQFWARKFLFFKFFFFERNARAQYRKLVLEVVLVLQSEGR